MIRTLKISEGIVFDVIRFGYPLYIRLLTSFGTPLLRRIKLLIIPVQICIIP